MNIYRCGRPSLSLTPFVRNWRLSGREICNTKKMLFIVIATISIGIYCSFFCRGLVQKISRNKIKQKAFVCAKKNKKFYWTFAWRTRAEYVATCNSMWHTRSHEAHISATRKNKNYWLFIAFHRWQTVLSNKNAFLASFPVSLRTLHRGKKVVRFFLTQLYRIENRDFVIARTLFSLVNKSRYRNASSRKNCGDCAATGILVTVTKIKSPNHTYTDETEEEEEELIETELFFVNLVFLVLLVEWGTLLALLMFFSFSNS